MRLFSVLLVVVAVSAGTDINFDFKGILGGASPSPPPGPPPGECDWIPSHSDLAAALRQIVQASQGCSDGPCADANGGLNLDMWVTLVSRGGYVCMVAYSGEGYTNQWPGSRVISAQKANTANAFSLPQLALSTANLYEPTQPGGTLFGLQESNPVNFEVAYRGDSSKYGTPWDPMVGGKIGGINVFGGGLALYDEEDGLIGALGVSGDTSCADHNIAWRLRHWLELDYVTSGVMGPVWMDNIGPLEVNGFGHARCGADFDIATSGGLPLLRSAVLP